MTKNRPSVLIVQPYVPKYREAFFSSLIQVLDQEGIGCRVAAASPPRAQTERGDASNSDWIVDYRPRELHLAGRTIGLGGARRLWNHESAVIVGHLGSSLDTYRAIYDAKRNRVKVGVWGHIKSYVNDGNPIDLALERWQLRQSHHIFAYTPGGQKYALAAGVSPSSVTTVMNATDTTLLATARDSVDAAAKQSFMTAHDLSAGRTLGYIGGLDPSKRIEFLAATMDRLWLSDPDIKLVVGGNGSDGHLLNAARSRGQVVMLGYASAQEQALIGSVSSALLMPGRIGLIAVDALVLGKPILTTAWPYHAPEHEYLRESVTCFTSANDVPSYVSLIRKYLAESSSCSERPTGPAWRHPTLDAMVSNFARGTRKLLGLE